MESLYLFEILLENFEFTDSKKAPENRNIKTNVVCGKLINFIIEPKKNESSKETVDLPFNLGKSVLFPSTTENMLLEMEKDSLHISVIDMKTVATIGIITVKWPVHFLNAIKEHNKTNKMKPVLEHNQYDIIDVSKNVVGKLSIFMRLNTFGQNIEIDFQRMASTINVNKIKSRLRDTNRKVPDKSTDELASWKPLFQSPFIEKRSYMESGMQLYAEMQGLHAPPTVGETLTTDYINKHLCGSKYCPGAQKFKDYGLGPSAPTGAGLGTLGTSIKMTKTHGLYGLSQGYGNMDNYGAFGLFVKNRNKQTCGSPDCPHTNVLEYQTNEVKNISSNQRKQSISPNCGGTTCPYSVPQSTTYETNYVHCGGTTCPYSAEQNFTNDTNYNKYGATSSNCGGTTCPYSAEQNVRNETNYETCGGQTCPYSVNQIKYSSQKINKNYGGISSYAEAHQNSNTTNYIHCGGQACPHSATQMKSSNYETCGGQTCPYSVNQAKHSSQKMNKNYGGISSHAEAHQNSNATNYIHCGGQACPHSATQMKSSFDQINKIPCGGSACPFSIKENSSATNNCGGQTCPFSTLQMQQNISRRSDINCGGVTCPFSEKYENIIETDGNLYGDQNFPLPNTESLNRASTTYTYTITQNQIIANEIIGNNYDGKPNEMTSDFNELKMDTNVVLTKKNYPQTFEKKGAEKKPETGKTGSTKTGNTKKYYSRFVYRGERYPGTRIGHKTCYTAGKNVPSYMGWLWNVEPEGVVKRRKSWRPGFVSKIINDRIIARREELGIPEPPALTMLVARKKVKYIRPQASNDDFFEELQPKPTLLVHKKDGRYVITMNPLKDPKTLAENENPYMECSPMQFILVKNKPPRKPAITDTSEMEGEGEEDDEEEEYELGYEASDERNIYENEYTECYCDDDLTLLDNCSSSSSESEFNLEFTTPAGIIIPGGMKKLPNVVHTQTQFQAEDWNCTDCPIIIPKKFKHKKKVRLRLR